MSDWMPIDDLLDRSFSLYSSGQSIGPDGGIVVNPVIKYASIPASIQPISGQETLMYGKEIVNGLFYFICLEHLNTVNGDIVVDDFGNSYNVIWFTDVNVATGRYYYIVAKILKG